MKTSWTDKLKQMELPPPENGWEKVAASLDESFSGHEFPDKLYNLVSEPSAAMWSKIEQSLANETTPVSSSKQRVSRVSLIRYAVAACMIGILSFAIFQFFPFRKTNQSTVGVNPGAVAKENLNTDTNANTNTAPDNPVAHTEGEKEAQALEDSKHTYARLDLSHHTSNKIRSNLYRSPVPIFSSVSGETDLEKNPEIQYSHRAAVNDSPEDNDATRYLMFRDNEGRFIKISKKLSGLFCCVSGEEQDENCHDQLKKWREKIASSSFIPSPDNFMDILELVNSLQDNHN